MQVRVLTILVVVYVFNFVDRNLMSILAESIKRELDISDSQLGLLMGPAFALLYTVAGIPVARLADRHPRRVVLAIGLTVWSLATAMSGLVRSFAQMTIARVIVGIGEASASPSAHSLISDVFPPERRSSAIAIYNSGASIGIFAGLALGGFLNDAVGWRNAFLIVGLPGVLICSGCARSDTSWPPPGSTRSRPTR
jgi:predicted MFS family arabinose efflux permease